MAYWKESFILGARMGTFVMMAKKAIKIYLSGKKFRYMSYGQRWLDNFEVVKVEY